MALLRNFCGCDHDRVSSRITLNRLLYRIHCCVPLVNFYVCTEFRLQNPGAVRVGEGAEIVASTANALLARARPGNQTDEMHLAVTTEIPEIRGQNMQMPGITA